MLISVRAPGPPALGQLQEARSRGEPCPGQIFEAHVNTAARHPRTDAVAKKLAPGQYKPGHCVCSLLCSDTSPLGRKATPTVIRVKPPLGINLLLNTSLEDVIRFTKGFKSAAKKQETTCVNLVDDPVPRQKCLQPRTGSQRKLFSVLIKAEMVGALHH